MQKIGLFLVLQLLTLSCAHRTKIAEHVFDSEAGKKKLEEAAYNVPIAEQTGPLSFAWVKNSVDWPIIELKIEGQRYFALIDSGSTLSAVREDSPLLKLASEKVSLPQGIGGFYRFDKINLAPTASVKNVYFLAYTKAVHEPKFNDFPCCDMILGQDFFQAFDVTFKKNSFIAFSKVGEANPAPDNSNFKIEKFERKSLIWTTSVKIDKKVCDKARVDTAGSNDVLAIFGPWYGKNRPDQVTLDFAGRNIQVKTRFSDEFTGYVGKGICANLGRGQLFDTEKSLTLSLTRGLGFYHSP